MDLLGEEQAQLRVRLAELIGLALVVVEFVAQNQRPFAAGLVAGSWSEMDYLVARYLLNVMKYILPHYYYVFPRCVSLVWREFRWKGRCYWLG